MKNKYASLVSCYNFVNVCLSVPTGMFVSRKGLHELNHKNLSFLTVYGLGTHLNSFGCIM